MSTGKQDDAAGPTVRHIRSAMTAVDKIVALDISHTERSVALLRILQYTRTLWEAEDNTAIMSDDPREIAAREQRWETFKRSFAERERGEL